MQAHGWRDPRDFDKLMWELPIPVFDVNSALHVEIAVAAEAAEQAAASMCLSDAHFTRKRRAIRDALAAAGISQRIDVLVSQLLDS